MSYNINLLVKYMNIFLDLSGEYVQSDHILFQKHAETKPSNKTSARS